MENKDKYGWRNYKRVDAVDKKEVIVVQMLIGEGTEIDPCRRVRQYWDTDGSFLFEIDDWTSVV